MNELKLHIIKNRTKIILALILIVFISVDIFFIICQFLLSRIKQCGQSISTYINKFVESFGFDNVIF